MKSKLRINSGSGQLRWVILLLAISVILPTVCLLWFMTQAVKNERLAVRQKLVDVCEDFAKRYNQANDRFWLDRKNMVLKNLAKAEPTVDMFYAMTFSGIADGAIILKKDKVLYPIDDDTIRDETTEEVELAWQLEFQEQDYASALEAYRDIVADSNEELTYRKAQLGLVRCSLQLGNIADAMSYCQNIVYVDMKGGSGGRSFGQIARIRANASLLFVQLFEKNNNTQRKRLAEHLRNIFAMVNHYASRNAGYRQLSSSQRIFIYQQAMAIYKRNKDLPQDIFAHHIDLAGRMTKAEELSLDALEKRRHQLSFSQPEGKAFPVPGASDLFVAKYSINENVCILFFKTETVLKNFNQWQQKFLESSPFDWRVVDNTGRHIAGIDKPSIRPLFSYSMGAYMPFWKLELFLRDQAAFDRTAKSQTTTYLWTALLVIVLMLASGGLAVGAIGRQIKLNTLKNDFIATVSHELKTPLASMRVLVDTLLEGNYKDQKQATEYLQLTAKENERLSRLIDNFLTFSRMERNKQVFDMTKTSPAAIARAAAEAVKTKFSEGRCEFEVKISDNLPDVSADRDAIVTVLVNLLDNAYKYSYDDKHIELRVFTEDDSVCFSVVDNGVGMSRRSAKRIFKRFYQVDRSLSRRAQGCGLGLSIAKFIVDAHKGSISVDSKPGKGSTFTVKLPAAN